MKVQIDLSKCMGYGTCVAEAPRVFEMDEQTGQSRLLVQIWSPEALAKAKHAAQCCPMRAIEVKQD